MDKDKNNKRMIRLSSLKYVDTFKIGVLVACLVLWFVVSLTTAFFWTVFLLWWAFHLDSRVIAGAALALLVCVPILLSLEMSVWAEQAAVYVYFSLVITVVLQIIELWRERQKAAKPARTRKKKETLEVV